MVKIGYNQIQASSPEGMVEAMEKFMAEVKELPKGGYDYIDWDRIQTGILSYPHASMPYNILFHIYKVSGEYDDCDD